jgi:phosphatidylglycerol---prolipoprotein diacylglyceryl transferase
MTSPTSWPSLEPRRPTFPFDALDIGGIVIVPSPANPVAFSIAGIDIRWYALFMLAGVICGIWLTRTLAARVGLDPDWVIDAAPWVVLFSILGARLYYVLLRSEYFVTHPWEAINIRLGGLSFHGALLAGTVGFAVLCWRAGQPFMRWTDATIPGVAFAQAIGRWGNWANQEAFGTPTNAPWGLWIDPSRRPPAFAEVDRFHPTFLYESAFNLVNAIVLAWIALRIPESRRLRHGDVLAFYLMSYGLARFLIERLRTDSLYIGPLPAAYWLSWGLIAGGIALLVLPRWPQRSDAAFEATSGEAR